MGGLPLEGTPVKSIQHFPRILVYTGPVDFRKRRQGLAVFVQEKMEKDPFSNTLYVFFNTSRTLVRILYWDKNGFALWEKGLEQDKFPLHKKWSQTALTLTPQQLEWLLQGIDFSKLNPHKELHFERLI